MKKKKSQKQMKWENSGVVHYRMMTYAKQKKILIKSLKLIHTRENFHITGTKINKTKNITRKIVY